MKIIGITGGMGSGKTKALSFFKSKGIPCYESDRRAKDLLNSDNKLIKKIKFNFGKNIYNEYGLDTKELADVVFNKEESLKVLNNIVHPYVRYDFKKFIKNQKSKIVFYESAIIFEHSNQDYFDKIILMISSFEDRLKRIIKRDTISLNEIKKRMHNQLNDKDKIPLADYVVYNNLWKNTLLDLENIYLKIKDLD